MIDHTGINCSNFSKSRQFYEKALAALGYEVILEIPLEVTGGKHVIGMGVKGKPDFWLAEGETQKPHIHIAFRAANHGEVRAFYEAGLANGGTDNGAPGPRPHYHPNYYGAFVLDPDGHNIEAVCHAPQS